MKNEFKLKQWYTEDSVQEATEVFEGTVKEYFEEHMNRIHNEQSMYRVVLSSLGDTGFFIELSDGSFNTVKCKAELVQGGK